MKIITVLDDKPQRMSGLVGFISWDRLAKLLTAVGEVRAEYVLVQIEADEQGLKLVVERKNP